MSTIREYISKFWNFLQQDTWSSWLVSLILIFIIIKFIFFPLLSLATGSPLPLVVVESCSMYHGSNFDSWWQEKSNFYSSKDISKEQFQSFPFKNGINKGDIIFVWNRGEYKEGDVIIFNAQTTYPIIHRIVSLSPLQTKGDHNPAQLSIEQNIQTNQVLGKSILRIPYLGWIKLIFFDPFKPSSERGLCN